VTNPHIVVILLCYNGAVDTLECVKSLAKSAWDNLSIIIVDNDSADNSLKILQENLALTPCEIEFEGKSIFCSTQPDKAIYLLSSGYNGGFSYGNNVGIRFAMNLNAELFLILNNDTLVDDDIFERFVSSARNHTNAMIVPQINYYPQTDLVWSRGGSYDLTTGKLEQFFYNKPDANVVEQFPVSFATGCCWFIPKQILLDVGPMEESYFMYVEDVEYCHRILEHKFQIICDTSIKVYHKVSASTGGSLSPFSVWYMARNRIYFFRKYSKNKVEVITRIIINDFLKYCIRQRYKFAYVHLKGCIQGLLN